MTAISTLTTLREEARLSQEDLAAKSGVSVSTIHRFEHGERVPLWSTVARLAAALEVRPMDLMKGDSNGDGHHPA